ncbi:MAG TPA: hypothetical protein VGM07_09880, partial [Stellaceae bacterium]
PSLTLRPLSRAPTGSKRQARGPKTPTSSLIRQKIQHQQPPGEISGLTIDEVVERYRGKVSEGTLANWRALRIGPSYIKIGKVPLYPAEELDRWDRSNLVLCRRSRSYGPEAVPAAKTAPADLSVFFHVK